MMYTHLVINNSKHEENNSDYETDEIIVDKSHSMNNKNSCEANIDFEDSEDIITVPDDYMFPSFIVFILWGMFASLRNCLDLLIIDDNYKVKGKETR